MDERGRDTIGHDFGAGVGVRSPMDGPHGSGPGRRTHGTDRIEVSVWSRRRPLALVGLLVAVIVAAGGAAGCGGSDKPLSKAAYEKQVRAILTDARSQVGTTGGTAGLTAVASSTREAIKKLGALTPPEEIAAAHDAYVDGLEAKLKLVEPIVAALKRGDKAEADRLGKATLTPAVARRTEQATLTLGREGYDFGVPGSDGARAQDLKAKDAVARAFKVVEKCDSGKQDYQQCRGIADVESYAATTTTYRLKVLSDGGTTFKIARGQDGGYARMCTKPGTGGCGRAGTW